MLSGWLRWFLFGLAAAYGVLGLVLFLFPGDMAPDFAWRVTPFMTMTIGGWCLGNAWLAAVTAYRWRWSLVHPALLYLSLFGVLELLVLLWFEDRVVLDHAIAWLYVVTLGANGVFAIACIAEAVRLGPPPPVGGAQIGRLRVIGVIAFLLFVGFLGVYGLVASQGDPGTNRGIFPEVLSPFTLRAFGAFYLSLALGTSLLLRERSIAAFLNLGFSAYGLIVFITLAALRYIDLFDFIDRPGGLAYFGAYLIAAGVYGYNFWKFGTGAEGRPSDS